MRPLLPRIPKLIILVIVVASSLGKAQNIIPNPGFETYSSLPTTYSQISRATGWVNPMGITAGTPDYFNIEGSFHVADLVGPNDGNGYAGGYVELTNTSSSQTDYKEYMTGTLSQDLVAGQTYTISFYTAHLYGTPESFNAPLNITYYDLPSEEQGFLGVVFSTEVPTSTNTVGGTTPRWTSIKNDFGSGRVLIPSSNTDVYGAASRNEWVKVTLQYTATGQERYITIGQFRPGATTLSNLNAAYYLYDDFSVSLSTLPVSLISFTARAAEKGIVNLSWSTSQEVNSHYFEVQHSQDARRWTPVARVDASSESETTQTYNYQHANPNKGNNYYRLKMIDRDGTFSFSTARSITLEKLVQASLYPNPTSGTFFLKDIDQNKIKSVNVYSSLGIQVGQHTGALPSEGIKINWGAGLYFVSVAMVDGTNERFTLMVTK